MQAEIFKIDRKRFVGIPMEMSLLDNKTRELFKSFMPRRNEVPYRENTDVFDLKIYSDTYFKEFNAGQSFTKWAAVEVAKTDEIPEGMDVFDMEEGIYAMFMNHGMGDNSEMFQYIFTEWLPSSEYELDNRPHFDVLGEDYQKKDPDAMSEIWIPVKMV